MAYKILIADIRAWKKDCATIPRERVRHIHQKIRELEKDPWAGNVHVKQLQHYELADFRLRIGEYRVLFDKDDALKTITLFRVLHRSKLY
ncbi:MAG: type II toxin-antitoxin system RelE/ParE family toxin [Candidatus Peribacteraceae bacterium]|nr:type II toxin-antitoxin system RelE/ParE family toxin [Candidatus Peribacteraceae bacterium]MBP9850759.1 type II toxin-antitoxin system RelE/ParE family toxin [Candidatus Peribacteraceae bacterium]